MVNELSIVCERRKMKVNVYKCQVIVFDKRESEIIDVADSHRIKTDAQKQCKISLNG